MEWPMKKPLHDAGKNFSRGFTLVELLVVLAIIALISAATVPALQGVMQGTNVTQAGQTVADQINLAREIASAHNTTVEVRLIQFPAYVPPPKGQGNGGYNAIQLFTWPTPEQKLQLNGASPPPLSRMVTLPPSIVVSQDPNNYSQLLQLAVTTSSTMTLPVGNANYISFNILPSGLIPLLPPPPSTSKTQAENMAQLFLSVVAAQYGNVTAAPGTTGAPSNYVLVQLNPNTGTTLVYRP